MFQFPGLALFRVILLQSTRLSHSEIFGLTLVCSYPKLIAAYHVLHRLLVPRHPPCALIRFKYRVYIIVVLSQTTELRLVVSKTCRIETTPLIHFRVLSYYYIDNKKNCFPNMSKNFSDV